MKKGQTIVEVALLMALVTIVSIIGYTLMYKQVGSDKIKKMNTVTVRSESEKAASNEAASSGE